MLPRGEKKVASDFIDHVVRVDGPVELGMQAQLAAGRAFHLLQVRQSIGRADV